MEFGRIQDCNGKHRVYPLTETTNHIEDANPGGTVLPLINFVTEVSSTSRIDASRLPIIVTEAERN